MEGYEEVAVNRSNTEMFTVTDNAHTNPRPLSATLISITLLPFSSNTMIIKG